MDQQLLRVKEHDLKTIWIATTNRGKLLEFQQLLPDWTVKSVADLKTYAPPPETGKTFEENARIKAKSLKAMAPGDWVVADDSGLEVEGLQNLPGVHSARYAGPKASDAENNAKLLKMSQMRLASDKRQAQFRCVLVAYSPEGKEHVVEGVLKGMVAEKMRGTSGFGYDPLFIPEGHDKTLAELGIAVKNQISHRAQAFKKLKEVLSI